MRKSQAEPIGKVNQNNDESGPAMRNGTAPDPVQPDESPDQHNGTEGTEPARFRAWIVQQQDHPDDLVRGLAREVADDTTWPEDAETLEELAAYIAKESGHDRDGDRAIRRAWSLWSGQPEDEDQVDPFADLFDFANQPAEDEEPASYATAQPLYLAAGWTGVLAMPAGKKWPPPKGYTGKDGAAPDQDQLDRWRQHNGDGNLALRLPPDVVALDVDTHGQDGRETLAELVDRLGPLPETWITTSRDDGSGIRLFRAQLPAGRKWREKNAGPGIEILHHGHRYAMAWPSTHPDTGRPYRWNRPGVPTLDELADLPPAWIDHLTQAGKETRKPAASSSTNEDEHQDDGAGRVQLLDKPGRTFTRVEALDYVKTYALDRLRDAKPGTRNNTLNEAALVLGHFVPALMTEDRPSSS